MSNRTYITYVILNGPPQSGKSDIARELVRGLNFRGTGTTGSVAIGDSFATPLKHFFTTALGDKYESLKTKGLIAELGGYDLRRCIIDLAENYIKKRYGDDIFGRWLVYRSLRHLIKPTFVIVDDGGFVPEIMACPNRFVVRVERPGKTFQDDARGYVGYHNWWINNDGDLADLLTKVGKLQRKLQEMMDS